MIGDPGPYKLGSDRHFIHRSKTKPTLFFG
jgi:hypothetical protein